MISFVRRWASLYPGQFFQFMIGFMGVLTLFTFIRPLMFGAVGFRLTNLQFSFSGIACLQLFILSLNPFCTVLVMSVSITVKLPCEMKSLIFWLYSSEYRITVDFPLSVLDNIALFFS